jgi:hypothetical protein
MGSCSCTTRIQTGQAGAIRKVTGSKVLTRKTNPRSQHCIGKSSTCCSLGCSSPKTYDGEDLLSTCSSLLLLPLQQNRVKSAPSVPGGRACVTHHQGVPFVKTMYVFRGYTDSSQSPVQSRHKVVAKLSICSYNCAGGPCNRFGL